MWLEAVWVMSGSAADFQGCVVLWAGCVGCADLDVSGKDLDLFHLFKSNISKITNLVMLSVPFMSGALGAAAAAAADEVLACSSYSSL